MLAEIEIFGHISESSRNGITAKFVQHLQESYETFTVEIFTFCLKLLHIIYKYLLKLPEKWE